ncbi:MAG: DJ-1/PfpI family protein [Candidatus Hadarchaeales archaeon]
MKLGPLVAVLGVLIVIAAVTGAFLLGAQKSVSIPGRRILMVIAPTDFNDTEYSTVRNVLTEAGASVTVASATRGTAVGMYNTQVSPDISIDEVNPADYDAVVVIGGVGVESAYFNNSRLHSILAAADDQGKVVGAICIAPVVLANAGILDGRRATVFDGAYISMLVAGGATYTGESVTVDGNIITANGPGASSDFARKIVEALSGA